MADNINKVTKQKLRSNTQKTRGSFTNLSLLASAIALAPQLGHTQSGILEEVMVTAQKRSESLQDIPVAVSAFTGSHLTEMGIDTTQDLQLATPGLVYGDTSNFAQPYIRGIGTDITTPGADSSVATFIDGVYQSQPYLGVSVMHGLERVEILKGPQGTLYGRNATGGTINIITKNPSEEFTGDVALSYGNENALEFRGYVSAPINEHAAFNLSALVSERDALGEVISDPAVSPTSGEDAWDQSLYSLRAKLAIYPSDNTTLLFAGSYFERDDSNVGYTATDDFGSLHVGSTLEGAVPGPVLINGYSHDTTSYYANETPAELWSVSVDLTHQFDSMDFKSITAYSEMNQNLGLDFDATSLPLFTFSVANDNGQYGETFTQEFQLTGASDNLTWLLGAFYLDDTSGYDPIAIFQGPAIENAIKATIDTEAWALFAHASYSFTDSLTLTAGIRYNDEEKEQSDFIAAGSIEGLKTAPNFGGTSDLWTDTTYKLALDYRLYDDILIYGKFETGFKSGTFNGLTPAFVPGGIVEPEELDSYELGIKSEFLDRSMRLNASAFLYDYQNLQNQFVDAASGGTLLENADEAELMGLEVELTWLATEQLTLSSGLSFLDTEYTDFVASGALVPNTILVGENVPGNSPVPDLDVSGNDVVRSPDYSFNVNVRWDIPISSRGVTTLSALYYYTDDFFYDVTNRTLQDSYQVVNAGLMYRPNNGSWYAELWGNNITDEEYFNAIVTSAAGDTLAASTPRMYGIRVGYEF